VRLTLFGMRHRLQSTKGQNGGCHIGSSKCSKSTLTGSHLLVATGRVPNTEKLNLEAAGIKTDQNGAIQVKERLETSVPGVSRKRGVK